MLFQKCRLLLQCSFLFCERFDIMFPFTPAALSTKGVSLSGGITNKKLYCPAGHGRLLFVFLSAHVHLLFLSSFHGNSSFTGLSVRH